MSKIVLDELLTNLTLTKEELKKFRVCGGTGKNHKPNSKLTIEYYHTYFKEIEKVEQPELYKYCQLCGTHIEQNCWITDNKQIIVCGNKCIEQFLEYTGKSCSLCNKPHKNRLDNYCDNCRQIRRHYRKCRKCCKLKEPSVVFYKCIDCVELCNINDCWNKKDGMKCFCETHINNCKCGKPKKPNFAQCYLCFMNYKKHKK